MCGYPPFWAELDDKKTEMMIRRGNYSFPQQVPVQAHKQGMERKLGLSIAGLGDGFRWCKDTSAGASENATRQPACDCRCVLISCVESAVIGRVKSLQ